jgi:histidinol phosphatase-like enzyme (inositol monophosphatase family)
MDVAGLKPFIRELAEESGALIRRYFRSPSLAVEVKDDATPVTDADRGAEELLRKKILARFPDHGIMAEELGHERLDAEWVWVLDPIDGTKSFVSGVPLFGTLIGLLHRGQPVLGAIHQPIARELCLGDGTTTTLNDRPVRVRSTARLADAVVLASDTTTVASHQDAAGWERLVARARWVRTWGDCYGYLLVATGQADVMTDPIMNPWDLLPLIPVIRGAGGIITDWQGHDPVHGSSSVAASPLLHPEVIACLNGGRSHDATAPSPWVVRFARLVPPGALVLDVAAGSGRHTRLFVERGYRVVAVDRDPSAIRPAGAVEIVRADLEDGSPWPLGERRFGAVVVTNYLHRPLLPILLDRLEPGGVLLYETFARGNERFGKPSNPAFLLERGELLRAVEGRLRVVAFEDVTLDDRVVQRIAAVRDADRT